MAISSTVSEPSGGGAVAVEAAVARLTGPGAPFELEIVAGPAGPVRAFARRERSLRELIDRAARRGDADFLVQGDRRLSFSEFAGLTKGTARWFADKLGLAAGERVAVVGANSIDWLLATFGATGAAGVAVVLNPSWTADELAFALADSGARFALADADVAGRIESVRSSLPALEQVVVFGSAPCEPADDWPPAEIAETDPFVIMYTSGTTGRPKGCITTHQGTLASVRSVIFNTVLDRELNGAVRADGPPAAPAAPSGSAPTASAPAAPATAPAASATDAPRAAAPESPKRQPALLATSPMFHVSGLHSAFCLSLATGTKVVIPAGRFDPAEVLRLIEEERITAWGGVPTMIHRVVDCPDIEWRDLSSLEAVAIGGAPLPQDVLARAQKTLGAKASLGNGYGLTETHGAITMNAGRSLLERPSSVGRPSPLFDVRLIADGGAPAAPGEIGEIQVRGVMVTPGYWNRPDANEASFADGWFRTGDLGFVDADGFLHIADRLKDMIIRGGENIYCIEVEEALTAAGEVDEAAVFGVPDPDLGERVAAVVHLVAGATATEDSLRAFLGPRLAKYKIPDRIVVTDEPLPRNATGKVRKAELRAAHGAALGGGNERQHA